MQRTPGAVYNPPPLPQYLKDVYDLKPVVGVPNDGEVKGIHAVLRTAHSVAHISGMFDPGLAMRLSQHLFEVQMARYRKKYPCGMFPGDMTHTPPTLPPHVSMTLEPVTGAPSDEEIQHVYMAVRTYEQMAVVPSMFDPNVGMVLSRHLFNIHFARYMSRAPQRILGSACKPPRKNDARPSARTRQPIDRAQDLSDEEPTRVPLEPIDDELAKPNCPSSPGEPAVDDIPLGNTCQAGMSSSDDRLTKIVDILESIKQILIRTHRNYAQGTRTFSHFRGWSIASELEVMNDEGELPTARGLPLLKRTEHGWVTTTELSDTQLALYLQFYNLGHDLLHIDDIPTIQDNRRGDAEKLLSSYLNGRIRPS